MHVRSNFPRGRQDYYGGDRMRVHQQRGRLSFLARTPILSTNIACCKPALLLAGIKPPWYYLRTIRIRHIIITSRKREHYTVVLLGENKHVHISPTRPPPPPSPPSECALVHSTPSSPRINFLFRGGRSANICPAAAAALSSGTSLSAQHVENFGIAACARCYRTGSSERKQRLFHVPHLRGRRRRRQAHYRRQRRQWQGLPLFSPLAPAAALGM